MGTHPALLVADHVGKVSPKLFHASASIKLFMADPLYRTSTLGCSDDWGRDNLLPIGDKARRRLANLFNNTKSNHGPRDDVLREEAGKSLLP